MPSSIDGYQKNVNRRVLLQIRVVMILMVRALVDQSGSEGKKNLGVEDEINTRGTW